MEEESADRVITTAEAIAMVIKATSGKNITFDQDESDFLGFAYTYFCENPEVLDALQELIDGAMDGEIASVNIQ